MSAFPIVPSVASAGFGPFSGPPPSLTWHWLAAQKKAPPILCFSKLLCSCDELVFADPALPERDLLGRRDKLPLPVLDYAHELRGLQQRVVGPGIEPCKAAAKAFDRELLGAQIGVIDISDFIFA